MIVRSLRIRALRAHTDTAITFAPKVNVFHGPNGAGKTNILEAVHYLCLSKSFTTSNDNDVLRRGCEHLEVTGLFSSDGRRDVTVRIVFVPRQGKRIFVNGAPLARKTKIVGRLPVVVFSQADHALTAGSPEERRRFLNNILCQERPVYMDDLLSYRRTLRQRNELLAKMKKSPAASDAALLASWDARLIAFGSRVVAARQRFLGEFAEFLETAYREIDEIGERPSIDYSGIVHSNADKNDVEGAFRQRLDGTARREQAKGRTLVGPHRDDLIFRINGFEVRRYASQGQHRTFGMAVKLAQYAYLKDRLREAPILMLDDVFDPLDARRRDAFLKLLQSPKVGQTLITGANAGIFERRVPFANREHSLQKVEAGSVSQSPG